MEKQDKYLVSACLAGIPCRYDCAHKNLEYINELVKAGKAVPICPEQVAGLPTPREACECRLVDGEMRVFSKSGIDYTEDFRRGAEIALEFCKRHGIKKAILRKNSPSCGLQTFDGTFSGTLADYAGVTAQLLIDNGIKVISSEEFEF